MKKIYALLGCVAAALSINAQQLPNNGFEGSWSDAYPFNSENASVQIGQNPESWTISHVTGICKKYIVVGVGTGKAALGSKVDGYQSSSAVELKNTQTGAAGINRNVPGYLTLGTTWSTAVGTNKTDGGTFGGTEFTRRPDAISFMYKRAHGNDSKTAGADTEVATVAMYSWKGQWSQADVPASIVVSGNPTKITMVDRERAVLGMMDAQSLGGTVTPSSDAELISKVIYNIEGDQAEWTRMELPIEYLSASTPAKINVIFAASDYFNFAAPNGVGNSLTIDDVKLIYNSRLADLKVNGSTIPGFDKDTYAYEMTDDMPADANAFAVTPMGTAGMANAVVNIDNDNNTVTITVTNPDGEDVDGLASHVYTLQYPKNTTPDPDPDPVVIPENATVFEGTLVIDMSGTVINPDDETNYTVFTVPTGNGMCDFHLPNFTIDLGDGPANLGNIDVENVVTTYDANGDMLYQGAKQNLELADGELTADVELSGRLNAMGVLNMDIQVGWKMNDEMTIPINVTFNGTCTKTSVSTVNTDHSGATVEYYNLMGIRVTNPSNGIYIRRQGANVTKVFVK